MVPAPQEACVFAVGSADDLHGGGGDEAARKLEDDQAAVHIHGPLFGFVQVPRGAVRGGGGPQAFHALGDEGLNVEWLGGVGHAGLFHE
ncbi:hypothetical protein D3C72_2011790 [compost metagenome]